jgi:ADP-ribose pyrophosphatase YjhB (NUDIX family)
VNEPAANQPLTEAEWGLWAALTRRIEFVSGRIPQEAFFAFCGSFISAPIEVAILNANDSRQLLLTHRRDPYFNGWHLPGKVLVPGKTAEETLSELIDDEIGVSAQVDIIESLGTIDIMKGDEQNESPRGQERKTLYIGFAHGELTRGRWFDLYGLPQSILPQHTSAIALIRKWAQANT